MKKLKILLFIIFGLTAITGFSQEKFFDGVGDTGAHTVVELAESDERFSRFLSLLKASGVDTSIEYTEGYTIFMPTNEAFGEMEIEKLNKLSEPDNQIKLINFVRNYILPTKVNHYEFEDSQVIDFEGDQSFKVSTTGETVYIGGAQIIQSDVEAEDGIIHVINKLVTPASTF
ncbi:fasciclin domain-containing protein [Salegentibacter sp. JZCK2]|uniref:fasciclin domain-containing protein n=1 Tax=Salegentibacter tibetensis TaxID=2873600 RepID=UPI001CD00F53|nr:fasciclin domain-containing protein [Salegentibacter tibetensis]MBZ9728824.1 fasciclin domain-containing protein [Salegentibacter tibetensis]